MNIGNNAIQRSFKRVAEHCELYFQPWGGGLHFFKCKPRNSLENIFKKRYMIFMSWLKFCKQSCKLMLKESSPTQRLAGLHFFVFQHFKNIMIKSP